MTGSYTATATGGLDIESAPKHQWLVTLLYAPGITRVSVGNLRFDLLCQMYSPVLHNLAEVLDKIIKDSIIHLAQQSKAQPANKDPATQGAQSRVDIKHCAQGNKCLAIILYL